MSVFVALSFETGISFVTVTGYLGIEILFVDLRLRAGAAKGREQAGFEVSKLVEE